ncbi:hypothetical protein CLOSTHATH_02605 [Hungatella hathewayi DSM 13479]|uniref:Uncharacterized protein n=1 Tax=Hungatella hathewayi DSM 13479 TaxID=566550 RepID=D3AG69_9FIRM|nr:hypothetical protein CLOSTHATH_02605 [Hungatella hathewayi DSM 13479]
MTGPFTGISIFRHLLIKAPDNQVYRNRIFPLSNGGTTRFRYFVFYII